MQKNMLVCQEIERKNDNNKKKREQNRNKYLQIGKRLRKKYS